VQERQVHGHRQLKVWQRAVAFAVEIARFCDELRAKHFFSLADQLMDSSISVPSNIAEGNARGSKPDYRRFVRVALGSLAESDTQIEIVQSVGRVATSAMAGRNH